MKYDAMNDVVKFNETSGNTIEKRPLDHPLVKLYLNLIDEELNGENELLDSYRKGDVKGVGDGAADLIVVTAGLMLALGWHPNELMKEVNASNLSKFCTSESDARLSVQRYAEDTRYFDVHYKQVGNLFVILGKKTDNPDGAFKILKGINFFEPEIKEPA